MVKAHQGWLGCAVQTVGELDPMPGRESEGRGPNTVSLCALWAVSHPQSTLLCCAL